MRFLSGSMMAHFAARKSATDDCEEAMARRLGKLIAKERPGAFGSPLERVRIADGESRSAPLYDQSVYGSLTLDDKRERNGY